MNLKVIIKNIKFQNFKGFAMGERSFDTVREVIKAENGNGKTTFENAFKWVLGFKVDDVIPAKDNKEIPKLDILVEIPMLIDGNNYIFKRTQKEVYSTNKDTGIATKTNNESAYFVDGIQFTFTNYKDKINAIFGTSYENIEMLVNKEFFNSDTDKWKWENRRRVLFNICRVNEVLNTLSDKPEYETISTDIKKGYSTADIRKSITKEKKGYKDEQGRNDTIIKEKITDLARYNSIDFDVLDSKKQKLLADITKIQTATKKENANAVLDEKNKELSKFITDLSKLQFDAFTNKESKNRAAIKVWNELEKIKNSGDSAKRTKERISSDISDSEKSLTEINAREFTGSTHCSLCKQPLPADQVENAKTKFEENKSRAIAETTDYINKFKADISKMEAETEKLREDYKAKHTEYNMLKAEADNCSEENPVIIDLQNKITQLKAEIVGLKVKTVKTETTEQLEALQSELNTINMQLTYKNIIAEVKLRISTLKEQNKDYADKIAICEKKERALTAFIAEQISLVNDTINSKFSNGVSFALFNDLYKGGDGGTEETCICMWKGKRYSSMSTGERYFADLEVVKSLQREYGVNLPIFCDNAESITIDYSADQQLIELFAVKGKKLDGVIPIENIL